MRKELLVACLLGIGSGGTFGQKLVPGDAQRGEQVFRTENCTACHSIRGQGGKAAPDLGRIIGRSYTPSWMASLMWNHAPAMWEAMEKRGIAKPQLTEEQAADLFAYFHSVGFFERPGDAARGKRVFYSRHCAECHGLSSQLPGGGPPVISWQSLTARIVLAQQMWNHASRMEETMKRRGIRWPNLSAQELTDLLVYLQNLPGTRGRPGEFDLGPTEGGELLFKEKGCAKCHQGKLALENRLTSGTLTDFAVSMWNHAPKMWSYGNKTGTTPPRLEKDEMRRIVSFLWFRQIFSEPGSAKRGGRVFARKSCATCHNDPASGAPDLKKMIAARQQPIRPFSMASVLWVHGPAMLQQMKRKDIKWPRFSRLEMVDLITYLNGPDFRSSTVK